MNWSKTQICNAALGMVGAGSIGNYDDDDDRSVEAETCRFYWPIIFLVVAEAHPWKCITKAATLTATTAPTFGFDYAYTLPVDFIRMVGMDYADRKYLRVGNTLQTDASPAYIRYVYHEPDATKYDAGLVRCLYLNLAYELAFALRQDPALGQQIRGDLERFFLPIVRMADAIGQGVRQFSSGTLTDMFND